MENNNNSLFTDLALEGPTEFASALAPPAAAGHFDELRGALSSRLHTPAEMPGQFQSQSQGNLPPLPAMPPLPTLAGVTPLFGAGSPPPATKTPPLAQSAASPAPLSPTWTTFFNFLGTDGFYDLNHRSANLQRQIRDNGVTYNVYADADGPQRPWSLDLFPMIVSEQDWAKIEVGVAQRARLLNRVMADIYGPQTLLANGLLPSALVHGHAGYLRAMNGYQPPGGTYLHIAAFDIAHGPDGQWSVVSQRTQAPSGLGYLLENRLTISLLFPDAFRDMKVQRLAATYRALIDGMRAASPVADSRVVLLTSGPYNETYFEHAYLARYLGLTLVEGSDLMVRNDRLFLKTLKGLEPVHGLLKRLDDEFLDPLELRSDSTLGVPGLLQVIRAGHVVVVNTPGSAFLESSALLGFLPALSRHLLGETLALPSQATWWCGERAVMRDALSQLKHCVIKPTYPGTGVASVLGHTLNQRELDEWAGRILRRGEDFTVQAYQPLSQTPTWHGQRLEPRSAMLRVFAVADGRGNWQVLPGGLARLAGKNENIASMQHGGSSADVWVMGGANDRRATDPSAPTTPPPAADPGALRQPAPSVGPALQRRPVTSRAAENLFWLGRYTERAENAVRLSRLTLQCLGGENQNAQPLLAWLSRMAVGNMLILGTVPPATQAKRVFERALIANLADTTQAASVGYNLSAVKSTASAVRERLSQDQWQMIVRTEADFFEHSDSFSPPSTEAAHLAQEQKHGRRVTDPQHEHAPDVAPEHPIEYSPVEALKALESVSGHLAAMTGAQTDRMTRDDGWRLLSAGRLIERLQMLAAALRRGFDTGAVYDEGGFGAILALFDSTITFNAQYQQRRDVACLIELLVLDRDNPRSLGWVLQTLRGRLTKLASLTGGTDTGESSVPDFLQNLPDPNDWTLANLWPDPRPTPLSEPERQQQSEHLEAVLATCTEEALELSNALSRRYFSHAASASQSLGA
ncbi:MAG: circularly permuted type 2 ATP-grasp protein [Polaromonas sp.]